jgi:hypothetical protein
VADYYVIDAASGDVANRKKTLNIPIAGLRPDCQLSVTITRRSGGRPEGFPFFEHYFSRAYPVLRSGVFLKGGTNGLTVRVTPGVAFQALPEGCWWLAPHPLVAKWEPLQPPDSAFLPMLWIADSTNTWTTVASNYLASISDRLQINEDIRARVRELIGVRSDDESRISILSRFVQTNSTYKAIEFGRRALIPNRPAEILANRYGDCKDHAVLARGRRDTRSIGFGGPLQGSAPRHALTGRFRSHDCSRARQGRRPIRGLY